MNDAENAGTDTDGQALVRGIWMKSDLGVQIIHSIDRNLMYLYEISRDLRWDPVSTDSCWFRVGGHCWLAHINSLKL